MNESNLIKDTIYVNKFDVIQVIANIHYDGKCPEAIIKTIDELPAITISLREKDMSYPKEEK